MKFGTLVLVMAIAMAAPAQTGDIEVMLQRAIRTESVEGDLKSAIDLYKKIIARAATNRSAAAKALLRLGQCYEKLGDAEAQQSYERLVREFADQKDQAQQAQARLAATGRRSQTRNNAVSTELIARGAAYALSGRVSPDGRWAPFVDPDRGDVGVRDLRTGGVKRLTNDGSG
jgi:tetratricopeptide (TPR) repeat protein